MTISHQGQGKFTIRSKQATIMLAEQPSVDQRTLTNPGEYEISGVEIEGFADGLFLFRTEDIFLLYLGKLNRALTDNELEAVNIADIVFMPVGGDKTDVDGLTVLGPDQAVKLINQLDPRIVIPMYYESMEPFRAAEGKPLEMLKELKITKSNLPADERQVVVLG
jgi:L-ascorbate metabolism protein UlaG (beta-lactamase superfamily)